MTRFSAILMTVALVGCGTVRAPSDGTPGASFPHPEGYALPVAHGEDAVADGAACSTCHALDVPGGDAIQAVPACRTCHTGYPHEEGFAAGSVHGAAWGDSCTGCHGELGDHVPADRLEARCTSCHSTFPHASGWLRADHHGAALLQRGGTDACSTCHADTAVCTSCHVAYPHPDGYLASHGESWTAGTCGTACHDGSTDQDADFTCARCHPGFPHPDGWSLGSGHAPVVQNQGLATCEGCHGTGMDGPELPVTCAPACHEGGAR